MSKHKCNYFRILEKSSGSFSLSDVFKFEDILALLAEIGRILQKSQITQKLFPAKFLV